MHYSNYILVYSVLLRSLVMGSLISGYEYDIFISYRQNDNKRDGWVTEFVNALKDELDATFKEKVHIYFDKNPSDGVQESHDVDKSLEKKLKCVLFIPIISLTYCDISCFAWQQELIPFIKNANNDAIGMNIQLPNGNVASRILPIKIHDIDSGDEELLQEKTGSVIRSIDFIYQGAGVNRPLRLNESSADDKFGNLNYRNQLNKVAMAVKDRIKGAMKVEINAEIKIVETDEVLDPITNESFGDKVIKRDLVKVGLVFAIISLVLWKAIDISITYFLLPEIISDVIIIVLAALLPVAILMAWLFERGPSGFIMTNSLAAKNNPFSGKQKKPLTGNNALLSLVIIMLVLYFVPQTFLKNGSSKKSGMLANKSIAVLYFDNMSGDPDQEYFSDGMTEEIIARLAQVKGLRVISRTSTHVYKGKARNLKKIADELNVAVVLEGSVRKEGNQIRITAQLIDAETDEHIWVETYTRELKEVFKVQSEIAYEIASKFEIDITPEIDLKVSEISTNNLEAYEYFLRGKHIALTQYYRTNNASGAFERAKTMYEKAINLDEDFAEPYAGLGDLFDEKRNKSIRNDEVDFTEEEDSLRHALSEKAIKLDPNSSWVNNTRAYLFLNNENRELDSGFHYLKRAYELDPNDPHNMKSLASFYRTYADIADIGLELYNNALVLNPMDPFIYKDLASIYFSIGKYEEWNKNREIEQNLMSKDHSKMGYYLFTNNYSKTEPFLDSLETIGQNDPWAKAFILASKGNKKQAQAIITENNIQGLDLFLIAGMMEEAFDVLKKYPGWGRGDYYSLAKHPNWDPYRKEADFINYLDSVKFIYDKNLAKYGPFADEILTKNK